MPRKTVTLRRWQLGLAVLILAVSYVVGLWVVSRANSRTHRVVIENRALIRDFERFRRERARETGRADQTLCRAVNAVRQINNRDRAAIIRGLRTEQRAIPGAAGALRLLLEQGVAQGRHELAIRPYLSPLHCKALPSVTHGAGGDNGG